MKKTLVLLFLIALPVLLFPQEKRLALVIGNGDYNLGSLKNPENDARSMEKALTEIGFKVLKYENLRQKELAKAIDEFGNLLQDYDVGLFFYAGHGIQAKGFNYLMPVDAELATESDIEFNCVRADRVLGKMEDAKNRVNMIILDACRNNPFEEIWTRSARGRGLATMSAPAGSLIAYATSPGKTASDGDGDNGLFTSGLLAYMNEPGITAIQMFQKVTAHVLLESRGIQLPWVSTSMTGDFFLVPGSGKSDPGIDISGIIGKLSDPDIDSEDSGNKEISLAILPFTNLTGTTEQDYLVKGQHDALYTELCKLSQVKPIRVVGGRTAAAMNINRQSIPDIAREINVDYIVEGSVMSFNDSILIQLRLIKVFPQEKPVMAVSYESNLRNIMKLHSNIAGQISQKINLELTPQNLAVLPRSKEINPDAYKAYLRGMYEITKYTPEDKENGLKLLHEAVALDPGEAFAYVGLALGYLEIAHSPMDTGDALGKAEAAVNTALRIDSTLTELYAALAEVYLYYTWDFEKAEKYFKIALDRNPNLALAHYHYSWALYLFGDMKGAIEEHILAQKYDPFNPLHTGWLGSLYCFDGQYEKAIETSFECEKIMKDYPPTWYTLGMTYLATGKNDEAIDAFKKLVEIYPTWTWSLGYAYSELGMMDEAKEVLDDLEKEEINPWNAWSRLVLNTALGNYDEAYKWLDHKPAHAFIPWAAVMPELNKLHDQPRFKDWVKKLNLPSSNPSPSMRR